MAQLIKELYESDAFALGAPRAVIEALFLGRDPQFGVPPAMRLRVGAPQPRPVPRPGARRRLPGAPQGGFRLPAPGV
ncbi:MAG: hypothetical protein KGJ41_10725 [Rhodospirillales bacterium]|nr:hypothetical protein [Rhodospirillales bacterium]MDE2199484.1 hypothetical protein [Rhodospirillales bacterium]